jgi:putative flippase GtrA
MSKGAPERPALAHWLGFLAAGGLAFVIDAGILAFATRVLGMDPLVSRIASVAVATVAGWLAHRTWTFAVEAGPSIAELLRYVLLQAGSIAVNYAIYAAILVLRPGTEPLAALLASSALAAAVAYIGMRRGVFRRAG